ncbi:hypothetical protein F4813DRAFT_171064 [Daldinia decipiens]|uniref:uncharacterized protein n=1 Tax=Daldinia decipiens TaxID=326647 RepID=UPI0020C43D3E|nr:uncharacterized protein F4813DRAFT_171064 [Daldinia decipiens]KAI1661720.1 hypothetical protein F4813DRAFT_171064 [Daldinia decipiens]
MTPDDRGPQLAIIVAVFLGLSSITVALRCYVRAHILRAFRVEDWLAVATMLCFVFYSTIVMLGISHGAGKHISHVPTENIPKILKMRWVAEILYVVTSLFLKFTVGIFLFRICSQVWQKSVICTVLLLYLVYHIFYAFMTVFQCQPVAYFWFRYTSGMEGKCWSNDLVMGCTYAAASINAVTDWVLGLLPIMIVRSLELSKRSKILVSCTLALGSVASTATIVRIPYIWQLTQPGDFIHDFSDLSIWSTIENGLGLVASSIATLRPLVRVVLGGTRVGTASRGRRSFYSWRRSGPGAAQNGNQQYYKMEDYYRDSACKAPEQVRVSDRRVSDTG